MNYNLLTTSEGRSVAVFSVDGEPQMVTDSHPHYLRVIQALDHDEDPTRFLDASYTTIVTNLSARVSVVDGVLHFDGDPVYNGLASTIQRYFAEGREDASNLVRFMERLSLNPDANSREQLFNWTQAQNLTVDSDGFIVGFKGVYSRTSDQDYLDDEGQPLFPLDEYPYQSSTGGHGIVDGHEINGHLPYAVGAVVEMPRSEVNNDPNQGCSTGLHVGTYDYAKGYSQRGALLEVRFDPADVVSVPADCGFAKLRCCKYTAVAIHEPTKQGDLSDYEPEATFDQEAAWDEFMTSKPKGNFFAAVRDRLRRKGKGEVEV